MTDAETLREIAKAEQERIAYEHDALMRKIRALKGWKKWLFILAFGNYPWSGLNQGWWK